MRRIASLVSMSSSISNGGVSAFENTSIAFDPDLDRAGRELGVDLRAARADLAGDADAPLGRRSPASACAALSILGVEDDLGEAVAVAEVDEHAAAVVATRLHPAEEDDLLADVAGAQVRRSYGSAYAWRGTCSWRRTYHYAGAIPPYIHFPAVAIRSDPSRGQEFDPCAKRARYDFSRRWWRV